MSPARAAGQPQGEKTGRGQRRNRPAGEAAAKAQEATAQANQTLCDAYKDASDFTDLISGLLGKDNELVKKMPKFRS